MKLRKVAGSAAIAAVLFVASACGGEGPQADATEKYPQKSIDLVVGFGAGGALDLVARALADNMKEPFNVTVINRDGAGGTIAASEVVRAKPDGYTAYLASTTIMTAQPHRNADLAYQGPDTYTPLLKVVSFPQVLAISSTAPYRTVAEFLDYAKANPGKIRVGTGGEGTIGHLTMESVAQKSGISYTHVPFQGFSESVPALLGGHVEAVMATPADVVSHVKAGKMKPLAVFSSKRAPVFPDAPTMAESGIDEVQDNYYFVILPPGVDPAVASALRDAFKAAMETPGFTAFAEDRGAFVDYADEKALTDLLNEDYAKFGEVIKRLGL